MSEPIIQIEHLNKTFGAGPTAVHALEDINLAVQPGEIFGIIGLSGAGKSTLVRCMNLLERPTSGSVVVDGKEMTKLSTKDLNRARQSIGMIFQSFNLLMQRTALDNVCFPLELIGTKRPQARKRAQELLDLVGLGDRAGAYPAQLSGGQKQRVAIARALATSPKVLLCDEATSALDPTTTLSILALLKELNEKLGVTVVVITHQMNVIEEICHRVAILDHGVIAEQGSVEDIFSHPQRGADRPPARGPGDPHRLQRRLLLRAPHRLPGHRLRGQGEHPGGRHPKHRGQGLRHHAPGPAGGFRGGRQGPAVHPIPA